jgi:hypothetical protein
MARAGWEHAATLELHVGTFTPGGTFPRGHRQAGSLCEAGLTAIELMPIADFAGRRNWGYDGVLLYAPDSAYGRPDDLRMLIDEAHARGLMVFLDVVYNHFGPEGNHLHRYAPAFFASAHTPWGHAIDYRVPQVRPLRSKMRCIGSSAIVSTAFGSTRCTCSWKRGSRRCCMTSVERSGFARRHRTVDPPRAGE